MNNLNLNETENDGNEETDTEGEGEDEEEHTNQRQGEVACHARSVAVPVAIARLVKAFAKSRTTGRRPGLVKLRLVPSLRAIPRGLSGSPRSGAFAFVLTIAVVERASTRFGA